jgi:predicted nucleotide-binding protein (sugar kinase/HSP70/actin superfamily)
MGYKIGIPKALLYFRYGTLWENLLRKHGFDIIISKDSSKSSIDYAQRVPLSEFCIPVKLYLSHVKALLPFCDYLFLPRLIALKEGFSCPKLIGLPEIVSSYFDSLPILSFSIDLRRKKQDYPKDIRRRFKFTTPIEDWVREEEYDETPEEKSLMLISHPYILNDALWEYITKYLSERVNIVTPTHYSSWKKKQKIAENLFPNLFWCYEKELLGAGILAARDEKIGGIIQIIAFNCGPDTIIADIIRQEANKNEKPYLLLVIDEHTTSVGVETRLETFLDIRACF